MLTATSLPEHLKVADAGEPALVDACAVGIASLEAAWGIWVVIDEPGLA